MLGVWYFLAHLLSPHFVKCPSPLASSPLHHFCPGTLDWGNWQAIINDRLPSQVEKLESDTQNKSSLRYISRLLYDWGQMNF